jgi:hypothetical protein
MELDRQEFIDLRCKVRFDAVTKFYDECEPLGVPFEEWIIDSIERDMLWPELKAFEDFQDKYAHSEIQWR